MIKKALLMSTFIALFSTVICHFTDAPQNVAYGANDAIQITTIWDGDTRGTASLYGNGETYVTDLKVIVRFEDYAPYEIELEDGYSPYISTFDFGAEDKLLFCSSQTGGSGGYGNYRIYRLKTNSYRLLYDDKTDSKITKFDAEFQPDGFMRIRNQSTQYTLDVSVGYVDKSFYDMIFAPDGSVKGVQPYVNDISFVSPSLNPTDGLWRLITYRSVVAVAEVNRLGYIVQTLYFDGSSFIPAFTEFSISLQ